MDRALTFESRDEYDREKTARHLLHIVESGVDASPTLIDGNWGIGKTEFAIKLSNLFDGQENMSCSYVNVFREDHSNQPLLTLISSIASVVPHGAREGFLRKSVPVVRATGKAVMKGAVGWILRQDFADVTDDFQREIQDASDSAINWAVESALEDHVRANESLQGLRESLHVIAKEQRLVVVLDELDRCRPDFALAILEMVKHVFDVDNVFFILVANRTQIVDSIAHYLRNC